MTHDAVRAPTDARPASGPWAALTYHELALDGRALAGEGTGYAIYCVGRDAFRDHLAALAGAGLRGTSIGEARARGASALALTFDDGCETDWLEAAPLLRERGFGATFFVVSGFLGQRGYLSRTQLRELAAAGFEIGSHSQTHGMLAHLSPAELEREVAGSRAALEDAAGVAVRHLSCPHGRWSPAVATCADRAGYETVSTSQPGLNGPGTPLGRLRRIVVQRGLDPAAVVRLARGEGLWRTIARTAALDAGKRVLGETGYAALRRTMMRLVGGSR
jgi:peptidoglycan/xylan/chitin deacetylase (PgdA/CDA1 family)